MSVSPDWRDSFFCLSKRKKPKKKTPPATAFGFPVLLTIMGGNQTRPSGLHKPQATAELKQVIAESSHDGCAARRGRGELKANHLQVSFGVIKCVNCTAAARKLA
jgi:hypothetical protein